MHRPQLSARLPPACRVLRREMGNVAASSSFEALAGDNATLVKGYGEPVLSSMACRWRFQSMPHRFLTPQLSSLDSPVMPLTRGSVVGGSLVACMNAKQSSSPEFMLMRGGNSTMPIYVRILSPRRFDDDCVVCVGAKSSIPVDAFALAARPRKK